MHQSARSLSGSGAAGFENAYFAEIPYIKIYEPSNPGGAIGTCYIDLLGAGTGWGCTGWAEEPPPVAVTELHVADLDGFTTITRARRNRSSWFASVVITVRDSEGTAVAGATVAATWSWGGGDQSCVTGSDGTCELASRITRNANVIFTVDNVDHSGLTYDASANFNPDGDDSNGTRISIFRP